MKKIVILFSVLLIFAIVGVNFLTQKGFFIFIDTNFFPINELGSFSSKSFYLHLRDILVMCFGHELYSKIFLLSILGLGAFLGYKFATILADTFGLKNQKRSSTLLACISVTFILFHPFLYERLVSQTHVALGIILLGLVFCYVLEFLYTGKNKKLYIASVFAGISIMVLLHNIFFLLLLGGLVLLFFWKELLLRDILASLFIICGLNLNWLIGKITGENTENIAGAVASFDQQNIEAFMQNSIGNVVVEITSFFGYGFWGEKYGHVLLPGSYWIYGAIILFVIGCIGVSVYRKKDKKITSFLLVLGGVSYLLALGITSPMISWFNSFLFEHIPYYIAMREPGKFLGFSMLVSVLFFLIGVIKIGKLLEIEKNIGVGVIYFLLLFGILYTYNSQVLFGFSGQLKMITYPNEYITSKQFIADSGSQKNLVFPWHYYMACEWTKGKNTINFYQNINYDSDIEYITADNIEIANLYTNSKNTQSQQIEQFLRTYDVNILRKQGINSIVLQDFCADFSGYQFLDQLPEFNKTFNSRYIKVYEILKI